MEIIVLFAVGIVWSGLRLMRCDRCGVPTGVLQALFIAITLSERCWACRALEGRAAEPPPAPGSNRARGWRAHLAGTRDRVRATARGWLRAASPRADERIELRRWLRTNPPSVGRSTGARV